MALSGISIRTTRNGLVPVTGYREDLRPADIVTCSLTGTTAPVITYRWRLISHPEWDNSSGIPPFPQELGTATTCNFQIDDDSVSTYPTDGSYLVSCLVNEGMLTETDLRVVVARVSGFFLHGHPLRIPAPFEGAEDSTDPSGYGKQVVRWQDTVTNPRYWGRDATSAYIAPTAAYAYVGNRPDWVRPVGVMPGAAHMTRRAVRGDLMLALPLVTPSARDLWNILQSCSRTANSPQVGLAVYANDSAPGQLYPGSKIVGYGDTITAGAGFWQLDYDVVPGSTLAMTGGDVVWLVSWFDSVAQTDGVTALASPVSHFYPTLGASAISGVPLGACGWAHAAVYPIPGGADPFPDPFPTTAPVPLDYSQADAAGYITQVFPRWA